MNLCPPLTGASELLGDARFETHPMLVAVLCYVAGWDTPLYAMLDTGAQWCILPPFVAEALGCGFEPDPDVAPLSTRFGILHGRYERAALTFVAERGDGLVVDATFFVTADWPGPPVIGWKGCLERIRFALDPDPELPTFYFAPL